MNINKKKLFGSFKKKVVLIFTFFSLIIGNQCYAGSFTASGSGTTQTLTIDLNVASQLVTVVATSTTYTFTLSGGATNTWTGTASANVTVSSAVLTVTSSGKTAFSDINITDSGTGTKVTFATSGANTYSDNINVTLDNTPGAVTFTGTSGFTGSNAINITTSMYIVFSSAAVLTTVDGNLTLDANTQVTPSSFLFSGISVNNARVEVTGTGVLSMTARGGTGTGTSAAGYLNKGIAVINSGVVKGGTTGTMTILGRGFTGVTGTNLGQGVIVSGGSLASPSTITSNGANVSVTGYGAISSAVATSTLCNMMGVVVGDITLNSPSATSFGIISSGGNGTVTVTGTGGTAANPASTVTTYCAGVLVNKTCASITSAGALTVTGIAGGPDTNGGLDYGVFVNEGSVISGTNGNLEVTGNGKNSASSMCRGIAVSGSSSGTGKIQHGTGTGSTTVTGTGGGTLISTSNYGIYLNGTNVTPTISSLGSGTVTVKGYGGNLNGTGATNNGIFIYSGSIFSSGGNVVVEGTGGGGSTAGTNYGITMQNSSYISAGGSGTVNVTGIGGNKNGISGGSNSGIVLSSNGTAATAATESYITSNGGDVTVTGTGGGGSSGSASGSSSGSNIGVYCKNGSYISAGATGTVTVTGTGGNTSTGATGSYCHGVLVDYFVQNGPAGVYQNAIKSSGGNVIVNGYAAGGTGGNNSGVEIDGLVKAFGSGTVTINGSGGSAVTGDNNRGVFINGMITILSVVYPATVTSEGGAVTVTGTGGGIAGTSSGSNNHGVNVYNGGIITAGGNGTVNVTGTAGQSNGTGNHGIDVAGGTAPNKSTITSGGGNVIITGTGPQSTAGYSQHGIYNSAVISSGGNGNVTITGNGGTGDATVGNTGHFGVEIAYAGLVTSGGSGNVTVTGIGGGNGLARNNYGIYFSSAGTITSGGAGTVTLNGTGGGVNEGSNHGLYLKSVSASATISSGGGNIIINGTEGAVSANYTSLAVMLDSYASITTATNGGNITINGNSLTINNNCTTAASASGSLNIAPSTTGSLLKLAATTDAKGTLYISSTELGRMSGGTINLGNSTTGPITVSQAMTVVLSGSNLNLATATSPGGLSPKVSGGAEITMASGKTLGLTGIPSLNIAISGTVANTSYDQLQVVGDVALTGMSLSLSGAYTPVVGNVFTVVSATSVTGTFTGLAEGATVTFNGIPLIINYTATTVTLTALCTNPTSGGTIASDQSGTAPFNPAAFTSTTSPSGQCGTLEYKWQLSTTSSIAGFSDIASSNSATYDAGALSATTWYKRLARVTCKSNWTGAAESNVVKVIVNALHTVTKTNETGTGSLKQAILDAAAGDYIAFDVAAMGSNTIKLTSPVVINKDLTIQGAAGGIVLSGNNVTKVLQIGTVSDDPQLVVRLEKLMVTKGKDVGNVAGGMVNYGNLTMVNCLVADNSSTGSLLGTGAVGGIYSGASLTLINCTIAGNTGAANNGGIGGLYCTGTLDIYNTIFYGNTGVFNSIARTSISASYNCLFEESLATLTNPSYNNLIISQANNLFGQNPRFIGSANNTANPYLILGISPCVDAGDNANCAETTDIRGGSFGRKLYKADATTGTIDIGAYEWKKGTDPNNIFTWTGTGGTEWSSGGNWDVGTVPTSADIVTVPKVENKPTVPDLTVGQDGSLTINAGSELTTSGAIENNGTIVIKSGASGTGSFIMGNLPTGTGFAMVERYMPEGEWHIISSPTGNQKINDFIADNLAIPLLSETSPVQYGMMDYNTAENKWNGYFTAANTSELGIGKGYMVRVKDPVDNLRFKGVINADATTSVSAGWNCIGNPFTSAIKINTASGATNNFMDENWTKFDDNNKALYLWNQTNNAGAGSYDVVNLADGAAYAQVGQGFFMKVKTAGTVSFTTAMQTHQVEAPFKSSAAPYPEIKLIATAGNKTVSTDIKFIEGTQEWLDPGYDAGHFTTDKSFALYTRLVDDNGVNFQLQCLPPTGYDKLVIPIGIDSKAAGEIVFSVETVQLDPNCKVILEDKLTNTFTDLSKGSYKAAVVANTAGTGRFYLHTGDIVSGLEDQSISEGKLTAYAKGNKEIRVIGEVGDGAVATLFNGLGQVVLTKKLGAGNLNIIGIPNLTSGLYLLNINDKGTPQTIKVMVRK